MKTLLLAIILASSVPAFSQDNLKTAALSEESIFQLESGWIDQNGRKLKLDAFRGRPSVLAMVYTSCQGVCPVITSDMQRIETGLQAAIREHTQFVLVSFDPERDTQAALGKFAKNHGLDLKHWTLLTGTSGAVRQLAAVLGVKYKKDASGNFSHSNVITVLDSEGVMTHQQLGLRQDPKLSVQAVSNAFPHTK